MSGRLRIARLAAALMGVAPGPAAASRVPFDTLTTRQILMMAVLGTALAAVVAVLLVAAWRQSRREPAPHLPTAVVAAVVLAALVGFGLVFYFEYR